MSFQVNQLQHLVLYHNINKFRAEKNKLLEQRNTNLSVENKDYKIPTTAIL